MKKMVAQFVWRRPRLAGALSLLTFGFAVFCFKLLFSLPDTYSGELAIRILSVALIAITVAIFLYFAVLLAFIRPRKPP